MNESLTVSGNEKMYINLEDNYVGQFTYGEQISYNVRKRPNWFQKRMINIFFGLKYQDLKK